MTSKGSIKFNIGKNGVTVGVLEGLDNIFENHKVVRISLLKSFCRDREEKSKVADELADKLKGKFKYSIIGYTIVMKKVGKKAKK